jgi:hypothetical protein
MKVRAVALKPFREPVRLVHVTFPRHYPSVPMTEETQAR